MSYRPSAGRTTSSSNMSAGLGQPKRSVRTTAQPTGGKLEPLSGPSKPSGSLGSTEATGARKASVGAKPRDVKPLPKPGTAQAGSTRPPAGSASSLAKTASLGSTTGKVHSTTTAAQALKSRPTSTPSGSATDLTSSKLSATGSPPSTKNATTSNQGGTVGTAPGQTGKSSGSGVSTEKVQRNLKDSPPPPFEAKQAFSNSSSTSKSGTTGGPTQTASSGTNKVVSSTSSPKPALKPPGSSAATVSPSKSRQVAQANTVSVPSVPWTEPTAEDIAFISKRRMETAFSGEYVNLFPDAGIFCCIRCKAAIARSSSKVRIQNAPYAAFQYYSAGNLEMELGQYEGMVQVHVSCKKCNAFIGELKQDGEETESGDCLLVNSRSVRYCNVSYVGKDVTFDQWESATEEEKRKMNVAAAMLNVGTTAGGPSPTKPKAKPSAAPSPQKSDGGRTDGTLDEDDDELDEDAAMYLDEDEIARRKAAQWGKRKVQSAAKYELGPEASKPVPHFGKTNAHATRNQNTLVEHSESSESEWDEEEEEEEDD